MSHYPPQAVLGSRHLEVTRAIEARWMCGVQGELVPLGLVVTSVTSVASSAANWMDPPELGKRFDELMRSFKALRARTDDWDGRGSEAPRQRAADRAFAFASKLCMDEELESIPLPFVTSEEDGTVALEWSSRNPARFVVFVGETTASTLRFSKPTFEDVIEREGATYAIVRAELREHFR